MNNCDAYKDLIKKDEKFRTHVFKELRDQVKQLYTLMQK